MSSLAEKRLGFKENTGQPNSDIVKGALTVGFSNKGYDAYDFGARAALVADTKKGLAIPDDIPIPSPWTVEIEPTPVCNSKCHFCSYEIANRQQIEAANKMRRTYGNSHQSGLDRTLVMGLIEKLATKGTKGIYWSGGGEPLVWPHIVEGIQKSADSNCDVFIQTNGIKLDKLTASPETLKAIGLISVSVMGHRRDIYREVAGVDRFEVVNKNLKELVRLRDKQGLNSLTLNTKILVDQKNYFFLPQMVKYFRDEIGADVVAIRLVQDYNHGGSGPRAESVELTRRQKIDLYNLIVDKYSQDNLLMEFSRALFVQLRKPEPTKKCYNATDGHFTVMDASGNVYLGNPEIGNAVFCVGNINEKPWDEIWLSERHLEVVALMDEMQINGECPNELCRHVRANQGAEEYYEGKRQAPDYDKTLREKHGSFL